jgi:hypothetical protein
MSVNSKGNKDGGRGRQDNSLSVLTKKFIDLIKNSENMTIDLNVAVDLLKVQKFTTLLMFLKELVMLKKYKKTPLSGSVELKTHR